MKTELHPEAFAELREAAFWYDEKRQGLGDALMEEVHALRARIESAPGSFPQWPGARSRPVTIRRALLNRFPYALAFEVHEQQVLVLAVAHTKRRPLYWLDRAGPTGV